MCSQPRKQHLSGPGCRCHWLRAELWLEQWHLHALPGGLPHSAAPFPAARQQPQQQQLAATGPTEQGDNQVHLVGGRSLCSTTDWGCGCPATWRWLPISNIQVYEQSGPPQCLARQLASRPCFLAGVDISLVLQRVAPAGRLTDCTCTARPPLFCFFDASHTPAAGAALCCNCMMQMLEV